MLSDDQRRGIAPIDPPPALGGALGEALERRVAAAGPEAGALLLVAAASSDRALVPVIAACRDLGIEDHALERCEAAGLLDTDNEEFRLVHPLLRGVVYGGAAPADRRRAHRALAGPRARGFAGLASRRRRDRARRGGRHRARAHGSARRRPRRAHVGRRCARAGRAAEHRSRRAAPEAATAPGWRRRWRAPTSAGQPCWSAPATRTIRRCGSGRFTCSAWSLSTAASATALENHRMLTEEAVADRRDRSGDGGRAPCRRRGHGDGRRPLRHGPRVGRGLDRDPARRRARDDPLPRPFRSTAWGWRSRAGRGGGAGARPGRRNCWRKSSPSRPRRSRSRSRSWVGCAPGARSACARRLRGLAAAARESRSLGILPWFQLQSADAGYRLGDWDEAEREADDAVENADVSGQLGPLSIALIVRARIHAARGREQAGPRRRPAGHRDRRPGRIRQPPAVVRGLYRLPRARPRAAPRRRQRSSSRPRRLPGCPGSRIR